MSIIIKSAIFFVLILGLLRNTHSIKKGCKTADISKLVVEIVQTYNIFSTVVLIYDEELESRRIHKDFIHDLHMLNRVLVTVNLGKSQDTKHVEKFGTSEQSSVLKSLLLLLYSRGKPGPNEHYTFIVWVSNPDILYTYSAGLHPGWKLHDRVILIYPRNSGLLSKDISEMNFWKHIPYVVGLKADEKNVNINVFTIYPYCGGTGSCYENLDVWSIHEQRFHHGGLKLFPDKFSSFYGATISAGVIWKEPFLIWGSKLHPYLDGLDWRLSRLVEKKLNATISIVHNEKIGRFENNTWTGMLRQLYHGTVDFALGGVAFTAARSRYFGFTRTYYVDSYTFISPSVKQKLKIRNVILKPFSMSVWYFIVGAAIFNVIMLFLIANMAKKMAKKWKLPFTKHDEWFTHIRNVSSFAVTQIFQKPCNRFPSSTTISWICNFSSLGFYILGILFITFLIANMTAPKNKPSVDKSSKIVKSGIPLEIRDYDSELNDYLRSSRPELWKGATLVDWIDSCQSIKRVSRGNRIYMDTRSRLAFYQRFVYNKTRLFSFHLSSENILQDVNLAWAMQKNWPFSRAFDRILSQAVESGLVLYWMRNFYRGKTAWDGQKEALLIDKEKEILIDWSSSATRSTKGKYQNADHDQDKYAYDQLTMNELEGIKQLFVYGCQVSVVVLVLEHIFSSLFIIVEMILWILSEVWRIIHNFFNIRRRVHYYLR